MNLILTLSVVLIGLVIIIGFVMFFRLKSGKKVSNTYRIFHGVFALLGALIVLIAALMGESKLWTNIIIATVIACLGLIMVFGKIEKSSRKVILFVHASLAIICYGIFIYVTYFVN
ncbi:MAG: hypothetical protein QM660_02430 [Dysgonomonas sp.]